MSLAEILDGDTIAKQWIKANLDFPHKDWCLIWPFSRSQTGYAMIGQDRVRVHRVMCEHRHGPPPSSDHYAAHSCDRGDAGCVNPWHLDWKTPSENQYDRHKDGIPQPRYKLTAEKAKEIRDLKGLEPILDTAARYKISESNVRLIQAGKTWRAERRGTNRILTSEEVKLIRATPWQKKTAAEWAKELGVKRSAIEHIRAGNSFKWVESPALPAPSAEDPIARACSKCPTAWWCHDNAACAFSRTTAIPSQQNQTGAD